MSGHNDLSGEPTFVVRFADSMDSTDRFPAPLEFTAEPGSVRTATDLARFLLAVSGMQASARATQTDFYYGDIANAVEDDQLREVLRYFFCTDPDERNAMALVQAILASCAASYFGLGGQSDRLRDMTSRASVVFRYLSGNFVSISDMALNLGFPVVDMDSEDMAVSFATVNDPTWSFPL